MPCETSERVPARWMPSAWPVTEIRQGSGPKNEHRRRAGIIRSMKFLRVKPGYGDVLLAEGDVELAEDERRLIEEFRRQLDAGMWAAVPTTTSSGRREATMVREFTEVPREAERVIFFPRAAGG